MSDISQQFKNLTKNKTKLARIVTKTAVRRSVSGIVVTLIHQHVPIESKADKAKLMVASWAVTGVVTDSAANWAADRVETYCDMVRDIRDQVRELDAERKQDSTDPQ